MIIIGLTGGIATGKSTVSNWLSSNPECLVIDADLIARQVVEPGTEALKALVTCFGPQILLHDGNLNRDALASIVFIDERKRKMMNRITHPYIQRSMLWKICMAFCRGYKIVILDVPLLFETGLQKALFMHKTIVVGWFVKANVARLNMERINGINIATKYKAEMIAPQIQNSKSIFCQLHNAYNAVRGITTLQMHVNKNLHVVISHNQ